MIIGWKGVPRPSCPALTVHGALDRIIGPAPPYDLLLPEAGHAFTVTHAPQTTAVINKFLANL